MRCYHGYSITVDCTVRLCMSATGDREPTRPTAKTAPASIASRMSGKINTNTNNNNNAKVTRTSGVLPNKYSPHQTRYEKPRGHSGYGAETSLHTVSHRNPPPPYTHPQYSRSGTSERVLAQPPGTPRERRRQVQNTERSGRQSPNTLSRSYSSDHIPRIHDMSFQQYHPPGNDSQKQNSTVTSHSSAEDSVNKRTSRERAVTKHVHKETEKAKPQVTRESRSREQDRTPLSVRRSQSLNRTSPRDSWNDKRHTVVPSSPKSNRHATTTSVRPSYDQSPTSSVILTGNRTSSERHRLPSESSSYNRSTASNSTPPIVTTSYSTPPVVTTSYSTPSTVTTASYTTPSTSYSTPSTVSKNKVIETASSEFPDSGGKVGISNLGNTCFMNSMLQCLGQTGEMTRIFLNMKTHSSNQSLVRAYCELMQQMWSASSEGSSRYTYTTGTLYPRALKESFSRKNPQFSGFNQHDSQEFMRFLLCGLHEELKKPLQTKPDIPRDEDATKWWRWYRALEASDLFDVFVGQLCSSLKCDNCKNISLTFDPFWELSVSLPKRHSSTHSSHHYGTSYSSSYSGHASSFSHKEVHLQDCLNTFTEEETLSGDERPYCDSCKSQQKAFKKMSIQRLPQVLVIHLKRFSGYGHRSKLDTTVTIPHTLDVCKYMSKTAGDYHPTAGTEYDLYAVSNHSGTVYFGHYTAWCKHYKTNKWYSYNDSHVSPVTVQSPRFSSSTAYVLFYRKKKKVTVC